VTDIENAIDIIQTISELVSERDDLREKLRAAEANLSVREKSHDCAERASAELAAAHRRLVELSNELRASEAERDEAAGMSAAHARGSYIRGQQLTSANERIAKLEAVAEAAQRLVRDWRSQSVPLRNDLAALLVNAVDNLALDSARKPAAAEQPAVLAPIRCDYGDKCPGHASPDEQPCGWEREPGKPAPIDKPHAATVAAALEDVAWSLGGPSGDDLQRLRARAAEWRAK
jgi:hypothetical protein